MTRIPIDDDQQEPQDDEAAAAQNQTLEGEPAPGAGGDSNEVEKLRAERDMLYEKLARAQAEFQNSRKRLQAEADQRSQYANANLIKSLLPVIDNFERALAQDPDKGDARTILKGMQIVHDQLLKVLEQQHVEQVSPEPGTPFDPNQHQAMFEVEDSRCGPGTIAQMVLPGYAYHERLIRPAFVGVARQGSGRPA